MEFPKLKIKHSCQFEVPKNCESCIYKDTCFIIELHPELLLYNKLKMDLKNKLSFEKYGKTYLDLCFLRQSIIDSLINN